MTEPQPGILADVPAHARYLTFNLRQGVDPRTVLAELTAQKVTAGRVVGLGPSLVRALGAELPALRPIPTLSGPGFDVPSTPAALWVWQRGEDPGEVLHAAEATAALLAPAFSLEDATTAFRHREGRDLTGYVDGTENPEGDKARAVALDEGASLVAVQRWVHDLGRFQSFPARERDHVIGRRIADNEEIEDAPESAHVKRTAQEDFDPEAFVLRRSMPWSGRKRSGLVFVAFGATLDPFEAILRRMVGLDDGITDALFRFTRPETGATFWCPPLTGGWLDLRAVGV